MGTVKEVANVTAFLSSFVNVAEWMVNGGYAAQ